MGPAGMVANMRCLLTFAKHKKPTSALKSHYLIPTLLILSLSSPTQHTSYSSIMIFPVVNHHIQLSPVSVTLPYPLPPPVSSAYNEEEARMCRVAAAVSMVERSGVRKVSVRRAATYFNVPKSTVHRHLQAQRGARSRTQSPPLSKCDINFLIHNEDSPIPINC